MTTRLVDILNENGNVIHTFPISLEDKDKDTDAEDTAYKVKALEAAASARLAPDSELHGLTARMHTSRGGRMEPYGDELDVLSQTKSALEQEVREHAYFLWERDGRPEGRDEHYWNQALEDHHQKRAYVLWEQEGSHEGHAEGDWHQIGKFQQH